MIKKADIILFIVILVLGLVASVWSVAGNTSGDTVVVSVNGETYGEYSLAKDREIEIADGDHINHITIKNGKVQMTYSSCENQVCVNTGAISRTHETIVCLPHRVMVEIRSKKGGGVDVISE